MFIRGCCILILLLLRLPALAHDPYEITSTIRIQSNRTELEFEMEFSGAMLLAGVTEGQTGDAAALFQAKQSELHQQAAQFFELGGADGPMVATTTNVTLGVENHVTFNLQFPAVADGLRISAPGLKSLEERGPFGTSLTVLDMVRLKVLTQSVLFANSPVVTLAPSQADAVDKTNAVVEAIETPLSGLTPKPQETASEEPDSGPRGGSLGWILGILVLFAIVLLLLLRRWRIAAGRQ